jgi:hypothetical protein
VEQEVFSRLQRAAEKRYLAERYFDSLPCATQENVPAGCSKRPLSKAAGELKPEAYPLGYVEDFDEPRTKLAGFFSILPGRGYDRDH